MPLGTAINNFGDIYFDYNLPVRTNTAGIIIHDTVILSTEIITGVNHKLNNESTISVYPNPVNDKLNIDLRKPCTSIQVEVYDLIGKLVLQKSFKEQQKLQINLHGIPDGMYLVKIRSEKTMDTSLIVKKR